MQIKDEKMNHFQEIVGTFTLINLFLGIFSLKCDLNVRKGIPYGRIIKMAIPAVLLEGFNMYTLYYKLFSHISLYMLPSVKYMDAIQMMYDFFQYSVDMWYVYKYGAEICLEYVNRYSYMDDLLTMTCYTDIKRTFAKWFALLFSIWLLSCVSDYFIWATSYGMLVSLFFAASYFHLLIKIFTSCHLSLHIMHIEARLRTLGDCVQTLYANSESVSAMTHEPLSSTWFCPYSKYSLNAANKYSTVTKNVKWFRSYYLLLSEQVKFINRMFGMRILLNSLSLFIDMVRFINLTVRIFMGSQKTDFEFYPAIGTLAKLVTCAVVFVALVYRSESAYEQRSRLLCLIDNLLVNKKIDESLIYDMRNFRDLVQARPISFNMANFFRIDNSFLVSTASVVSTYSIILLQTAN